MRGITILCKRLEYQDRQVSTWPKGIKSVATFNKRKKKFKDVVGIMICIEKGDKNEYIDSLTERVENLTGKFMGGVKQIVVMPFAHLSRDLESPQRALSLIVKLSDKLKKKKFKINLVSFGTHKDFLWDMPGQPGAVSYFEYPYDGKKPFVVESISLKKSQWNANLYEKNVEKMDDSIFQHFISAEIDCIKWIKNPKTKTFIDIGAGYGRIIKYISQGSRIIAIENDINMYESLEERVKSYRNAIAVFADAQDLGKVLRPYKIKKPVLLLLQNTLGTIKGDWKRVLSEMKKVGKLNNGEIVIGLLCQESLKSRGAPVFYKKAIELVGEVDLEKTDFEKGLFVSKTGYVSKWWNKKEREDIKKFLGGKVMRERSNNNFYILHVSYSCLILTERQ